MARKIVQISSNTEGLTCLCDDGSVWDYYYPAHQTVRKENGPPIRTLIPAHWNRLIDIPQDNEV